MPRMLESQLDELRKTMETYKLAADRSQRAAQSCCLALAIDSLERCSRLVQLALTTSPPEEVVLQQGQKQTAARECTATRPV
jgi:hypothetical protein